MSKKEMKMSSELFGSVEVVISDTHEKARMHPRVLPSEGIFMHYQTPVVGPAIAFPASFFMKCRQVLEMLSGFYNRLSKLKKYDKRHFSKRI